jgi:hypothetical protein
MKTQNMLVSQRGKKGSVGAPAKPIQGLTINKVRGAFTVASILALNVNPSVSELTIRKTISVMKKKKLILKNKESMKTDGASGRPSFSYTFPKITKKVVVEEAPVVETTPTPAEANPTATTDTQPTPIIG